VSNTAPRRPVLLRTIADARSTLADRDDIVLVPTMGALHAGHLALVAKAVEVGGTIVVSIFVNPMQFGPREDLARYPRRLEEDLDALGDAGVDFVFAPAAEDMYPSGASATKITAGNIGSTLEGRSRPGHFDGVLTVVAKLFHIIAPSAAVFGEKDAQQVFLVKRMVRDLDFPVRVETVGIVREPSGLALSSRNQNLTERQAAAAVALSRALEAAESSADRGIDTVVASAQAVLMGEPLIELDYLRLVDPQTFLPVDDHYRGRAIVLIAARVGETRLIDNAVILLAG